ncbi:MAG TPA: hypothetical protein VJN64_11725 [Terriglobales bacterium]|nr:hypothetical protein [Terriglobales bacterium]
MQFFLPSRKTLSALYQASNVELPEGGAPLYESFAWTAQLGNALAAMDSQELSRVFKSPIVIWGITGSFSGAGVFIQVSHLHKGNKRTWYSNPRPLDSVAGPGSNPFLLVPTYAIAAGDTIQVEAKSVDRAAAQNVEIVLYANEVSA